MLPRHRVRKTAGRGVIGICFAVLARRESVSCRLSFSQGCILPREAVSGPDIARAYQGARGASSSPCPQDCWARRNRNLSRCARPPRVCLLPASLLSGLHPSSRGSQRPRYSPRISGSQRGCMMPGSLVAPDARGLSPSSASQALKIESFFARQSPACGLFDFFQVIENNLSCLYTVLY